MRRLYFIGFVFPLFSFFLLSTSGCSTTKSVIKKIVPESVAKRIKHSKSDLKKRVMILPLIDQSGLGSEKTIQISESFVELLMKSSHLLLFRPPKGVITLSESKVSQLGIVTPGSDLIKKADDLGITAIITGVVNPVEVITRKTGIWPLRKPSKIYEISVVINAFDIMSHTLLLTNLESEKGSVPLEKAETQSETEFIDQLLTTAMPRILKRQASAISKKLLNDPWIGKILAIENGTIKINAGRDIGLRLGQHFAVFSTGESISSEEGRSFDLSGNKIGEISVNSIMEDHALAIPLIEGSFLPGQAIRIIP